MFSFPHIDKVVHFLMYFIFCLCGVWASDKRWYKEGNTGYSKITGIRAYLLVFIFAVAWGFSMEVFQRMMHLGREYSMLDMAANITGALVGAGLYWLLFSRTHTEKRIR